jgi:hypothetical protein
MGKRPSLFHQMLTSLQEQIRFGESKHVAKQLAIAEAKAAGLPAFGVAPEGIFSLGSFKGYRQVAREFSTWASGRGARWIDEAKPLVSDYLQERVDRGLAPATLKKDRAALRKIFSDRVLASDVVIPTLSYKNIKRSRKPVAMDKHFSIEHHQDLIDFATATGMRRMELEKACPADFSIGPGGRLTVHVVGKGGRHRTARVLLSLTDRVQQINDGRDPELPVFGKVPKAMDVHSCRRLYSHSRQQEEIELDKRAGIQRPREEIEREVSKDLGHNRSTVIRHHY